MIVQRIREEMRAQNWFAVAIEFLLLILGVFIGIEVANWNEARQGRNEERRYYSEIREDLQEDLAVLRVAIERSQVNDREAQIALAALGGEKLTEPPGRVARAFHRAAFLYIPRASRRTYDELISTGNLGLLRDDALKSKIVQYYARFDEVRQWDPLLLAYQSDYRSVEAGVLPPQVLRATILGKTPNVSESELRAILIEARSRERLSDLITGMAGHQERVRRDARAAERRARDLIAAIDKTLAD